MTVQVGLTQPASWDVLVSVGLAQSASWDVADPTTQPDCLDRSAGCSVFQQVSVDFMVAGVSRITWELQNNFTGPKPWSFQLQVGNTANPLADDWLDVGPSVTNTFVAEDQERRAFGKQMVTHYRVVLTDGNSTVYYSQPATTLGNLSTHDWIIAREHIRQENLRLQEFAGQNGYLLKRRRHGTLCPRCLDPYTGDVLDSTCGICKGTRFTHGYYRAIPCQFADLTNTSQEEDFSNDAAGWSMPTHNKLQGVFVGTVQLETGDLFVDAASDMRYFISIDSVLVRVRGVPVSLQATLEQLEFGNVVYTIPLDGTF